MTATSPLVTYGLLVAIGLLGAVADGLLFKAATSPAPLRPLSAGVGLWLVAVSLVYGYFRIDPHGFTSSVLLMIVVHVVASALIDWRFLGGTIGRRELLGFLLALAAIAVLEGGAERQAATATSAGESPP